MSRSQSNRAPNSVAQHSRQTGTGRTDNSAGSVVGPPGGTTSRGLMWLIGACLALATLAVYTRVLSAEFTYLDDRAYVTENATVQRGLTWEGVKWSLTSIHASNWHPITWMSHMLDCSLYGLSPGGHHFTNLLLHVLNTLLLFHLLCLMTGAAWPSAFVAGAFALHPAHVESVAWVAERKDVLSTFLGLLTMIAYVRFTRVRGVGSYLLVVALFALALSAKPMMVTLPFVLLLLDYWPMGRTNATTTGNTRRPDSPSTWPKLVMEKIPLFAMSAASCVVTVYAQRAGGAMMTETMLSIGARASNAVVSYAKYLWISVWPVGLAVYYPHPLRAHPPMLVLGSAILLLAISIVAFAARRRHPYLLVGWLWFLGTLVPVIGLVQVGGQALADRYTYVPFIGLFIMSAWGIKSKYDGIRAGGTAPVRGRLNLLRFAPAAAVLCFFALATWVQAGYWKNSTVLFQRALDAVPDNAQAHIFMANTLVRQGRVADAAAHYGEAVRIIPNEPYNLTDYGHALLDSGRIDEAIARLEEAIHLLPDFADAHFFLGIAKARQGRNPEAVKHLELALVRDPSLMGAHLHLGNAYAAQSLWAQAITHLQKWLQVDPRSVEGMVKLAQCYHSLGNQAAADDMLKRAADADPKNPYPLAILAQMATWNGDIDAAISLYNRALTLDPRYADAANNLALILATHPDEAYRDGPRAVQLAEVAVAARNRQDPVSLDTLAAALAEVGRYPEAVTAIDTAISLRKDAPPDAFLEHLQSRRALFAEGKPARAQ